MRVQSQKRDLYNSREKYLKWMESCRKGIPGIRKQDSSLILEYLRDLEVGKNVAPGTAKGDRSYIRLNSLRQRMLFFSRHLPRVLAKTTRDDAHELFSGMGKGRVLKQNGEPFTSTGTYVKDFKAFWHWFQRTRGIPEDITRDLSREGGKPAWVYLTEGQFKKLASRASSDYRALIWFMYDSLSRVTEAFSLRVMNFSSDFSTVTIPAEVAKTFERTVKLKLSPSLIREYVGNHELRPEDYLFSKRVGGELKLLNQAAFNRYLKRLCPRVFGSGVTKARASYTNFTLYDIRHNAACYWLRRYPSMRGLMYRGGWLKEGQVRYYSEFLGLSDEIEDQNMVTGEEKTAMEREIERLKSALSDVLSFVASSREEMVQMKEKLERSAYTKLK